VLRVGEKKDHIRESLVNERDLLRAQLNALMEALPFAAWFMDKNGNVDIRSTPGGKFPQGIPQEVDEIKAQAATHQGRTSRTTHSRDQRVYNTVSFPVFNVQGEIIGTGGYQEDITNLTGSLQILHHEREYLEALMENMPLYIFFTDSCHKYIRINSRMAGLLGVSSPGEALGKGNDEFFSGRVARKMIEEDRQIFKTGEPIINRIIFFEDNGVEGFWMEKNKIPIRDELGLINMIVGIYRDVSPMMEIENELKKAKNRAEESDRLKTAFLANMSHEIRTPMNGIIGFANLLRDPGLSDSQKDAYLKHIDQSSRQLLHIIDDIIDISKIESGQLKISNKPTRINSIMDEIYSSYFHRIRGDEPGQKKFSFKLEKGEKSADFTIVTDPFRLRQVFNNLINNAIKFTKKGRITFGYAIREQRHIEFFVSDTGIGIPDEQKDFIFSRFGQLSSKKEYQPSGTGLGLPISKNLVNLMGGEMWVESKAGEGTTFYFTLPFVSEEVHEKEQIPMTNKTYLWDGKSVLVVEDEELNWYFIREILRKTGAEIIRAKDGKEAVEMAKEGKPDAILMDIKMPEMDGFEATTRIREFNREVPIIAQTAYVMAEEREKSLRAGCNHFITKPIDRIILMELIDSYFNKKE